MTNTGTHSKAQHTQKEQPSETNRLVQDEAYCPRSGVLRSECLLQEDREIKQLGSLCISMLWELQLEAKRNMNDGHVTEVLPESVRDNCPWKCVYIQEDINHGNPLTSFIMDMAVDWLGHFYESYVPDKHPLCHSKIILCIE